MKLQTTVEIPESDIKITTADHILVMGSCFATNIGVSLGRLGLSVDANPFGVLYNPVSIFNNLLSRSLAKQYAVEDLVFYDQMYHSMDHHGSFSDVDAGVVLDRINNQSGQEPRVLIVTLGTAWVYKYHSQVVANCHKLPSGEFTRERLSFGQTVDALESICRLYPKARKVFTLSPIRHLKDGLQENSISKAILRSAIAEVVDREPRCAYFPAYEIMMDELRDYRFYNSDMLHPTAQAVEYIIEQFKQTHFDNRLKQYDREFQKILLATNHRPLHPQTQQYQDFRSALTEKIKKLEQRYPEVNISDLISKFA